ncbi:hypothetical protein [Janibacter sp. HTCC2649]|uniref:hypothetical protein n=1 Tax=Janibacter sp. HTCC2649 TaxID=313589 RepID=UPI0003228598|nr:hypothetical protein [Janibacter sp. HTCC2649]
MGILGRRRERWGESLSPGDRRLYAVRAEVEGHVFLGLAVLGALLLLIAGRHAEWLAASTKEVEGAVGDVERATGNVRAELEGMAVETAKAQRLAVWVGVGTAVVGAIVGGFAGAFAAKLLGDVSREAPRFKRQLVPRRTR